MMPIRLRLLLAAALVAAALLPLHASSPKFFLAATQNDFLKGDVQNLSIDSDGRVTLWNDDMERITGCPRERALGRPIV